MEASYKEACIGLLVFNKFSLQKPFRLCPSSNITLDPDYRYLTRKGPKTNSPFFTISPSLQHRNTALPPKKKVRNNL